MPSSVHYVRELHATYQVPGHHRRLHGLRHVNHDPRSLAYERQATGQPVVSVRHKRTVPPFDQGDLGSCTGNAMLGALLTEPLAGTWPINAISPDEGGAVVLYEEATAIDPYPGTYPPTDTGSDAVSVMQAAKQLGLISGYTHVLTGVTTAVEALQSVPVITGVSWYANMFDPDPDGRVRVGGKLAGGHEFCVDEVDVERQRVWFTNSWGPSWGVGGRAYLTWADWQTLLDDQGDVTVPVPLTQPAPVPTPPPTPVPPVAADRALAAYAHPWVAEHHVGDNHHMATALRTWLAAKDL